ncbi:MAG: hypothetical protein E4H21_10930 [Thermodesulfobacteriales bacterium]|nr:MAG: hypothetical protein E4H21_10930 [Thermodesulfobacteriales bacterium]
MGHEDLLRVTSDFPELGKLPSLGEIPIITDLEQPGVGSNSAAVGIVVVVVIVAVAARPGITGDKFLRAKLLDVYNPIERESLRKAIDMVQKNPSLVKATIGIDDRGLGEMMNKIEKVEKALI